MKTKILDFDKINPKELSLIAQSIKKGSVIICPTDTIYGISASAENDKTLKKIQNLKKRPRQKPFVFLFSSIYQLKKFACVNKETADLANKFWPGPLTIIMKAKNKFKKMKTIAARVPANKKLLFLLKKIGIPLASTSANVSGEKPLSSNTAIIKMFDGKVDYILLSKAPIKNSKPSTIINLSEDEPKMIRKGIISSKKIMDVLIFWGRN